VGLAYLLLFASLYAVQGVVVAYFFNYNSLYMEWARVPRNLIGWTQTLALLPFIFKFVAGPISDRINPFGWGHRKPYIVFGLLLQFTGLMGLSLIDPGRHLVLFASLAFMTVLGLALFDTCCDGMVIDVTPPGDRERVQGTLVGSRFITTMICSLAFGWWLSPKTGGDLGRVYLVLWACAGLTLVPLVQAAWVHEPARAADAESFQWAALRVLIRPQSLLLLAFGAMYSTISYGVEINLSPFYAAGGFKAHDVGNFAATRYLGRAVGGALLAVFIWRLGKRGALTCGVLALAISTIGQAFVRGRGSAAVWGFAFGTANGWDDALFNVLAMEASDPRMAASTYALFMAVSNVSVAGGGLFSSVVEAAGGRYRPAFLGAGVVTLLALGLVPALTRPVSKPEPEPRDVVAA
jgi:PAT family beta-lactamase induction signal transducer AmpG